MAGLTLEHFIEKKEEKKNSTSEPLTRQLKGEFDVEEILRRRRAPPSLKNAYLLSATYSGKNGVAALRFYDEKTRQMLHWFDTSDHKPYCFTSLTPQELTAISEIKTHEGLRKIESVERYHPIFDEKRKISRVVANDPLSIGGRPTGSMRDIIAASKTDEKQVRVWEADIKYYENYIYDTRLEVGMPYDIENGKLIPTFTEDLPESAEPLERIFENEPTEFRDFVYYWTRLLEHTAPNLYYAAMDIEVGSPTLDRVPEAREAEYPIICTSLVDSDGKKRVLLLRGGSKGKEDFSLESNVQIEFYDKEADLIFEILKTLTRYPIVVTFNGDEFDFRYIYHRAQRLGFFPNQIPIELGKEFALLSTGIHLDLYRFFFNRAIQIYAFDQKYRENTLDAISTALIGKGKIQLAENVSLLEYSKLAAYCLRDSEITYELTAFEDHLVMKLIIAIARVSKMPLEDLTRQGVSNWIRSMMLAEHRRRNWLVPTHDEIGEYKVGKSTEAIIKGKKYRGGTVIEPKPGVNFNVAVLDFSSLYPSIIKRYNLSYETILCRHDECKSNIIPGTSHWVCTKKRGLSSLLIGSLRDLRVKWYKSRAKDATLPKTLRSWYSIVQKTLKVILNASYGVFGAEHFALYCLPVAEATAAVGRYAINSAIEKAQALGIEVIYGDTDSVFLKSPTSAQIKELVNWSHASLGMDLDVDKLYRYTVFSTRKKNYIGVYPDGSVDIKGLTGKKRNTPDFLQGVFAEVIQSLSQVRTEQDMAACKSRIKDIVRQCYHKLRNKEYTLDELAFTVVLGKGIEEYDKTTPQHVKALKILSEAERERIGAGSVIRFVKTRKEPSVRLVHTATIEEIDSEKYMEHIQTTFEPVLEALDIDFNEIVGRSRLELFMS